MSTQNLFDELQEDVADKLAGEFNYTGDVIKYEYDGFQQYDITDIEQICYEDRCIVDEFLEDHDEYFTTEPEIHDKFIYFYIEK